MPAAPVIVFDTDCLLCSGMVRFVLRHERDNALHFAGAWSDEGLSLAARHGLLPPGPGRPPSWWSPTTAR